MTTNQRAIETDEEQAAINRGDVVGARKAYLNARAQTQEAAALLEFFKKRGSEVLNCEANSQILLREARTYGAVVTLEILELALLKVSSSLIAPNPPARVPTPDESRVANNKRLVAMNQSELRAEIQRQKPHLKVAQDVVSPQLMQMTRREILDLPGPVLTALLYRSDGSKRRANELKINEILKG
jgi:hypothetical protein